MYSTCLYCSRPLGANEVLEAFPVGRRIAFDTAHGRLWVVCRRCERWNLSPIEERWEVMDACEQLFHDTRTRVSTENIGLARLAEGLELVRVGRPQRPEFAAWRYGDQFGRRRRRAMLYIAGGVVAFGGIVVGGAAVGLLSSGILSQSGTIVQSVMNGWTRLKLSTPEGRVIRLKGPHLRHVRIVPGTADTEWAVSIDLGRRRHVFRGDQAEHAATLILPKLNTMGGSAATVRNAVQQIEDRGGPEAFLQSAVARSGAVDVDGLREAILAGEKISRRSTFAKGGLVARLPHPTRLAMEMALHEEQERRALEGELKSLEAAWRQAEEIASIADDLLLAPGTEAFIEEHRGEQQRSADPRPTESRGDPESEEEG